MSEIEQTTTHKKLQSRSPAVAGCSFSNNISYKLRALDLLHIAPFGVIHTSMIDVLGRTHLKKIKSCFTDMQFFFAKGEGVYGTGGGGKEEEGNQRRRVNSDDLSPSQHKHDHVV